MGQGLQKLNADQRLAIWTQRITDCRSSGKNVNCWCQENGDQRKVLLLAKKYFQNGTEAAGSGVYRAAQLSSCCRVS